MHTDKQTLDSGNPVISGWLPTLIVFSLTVILVGACVHGNYRFFYDDAFITLRYARHLIAGAGPIWNLQGPRVEGFSSPLHLLLISATGAMGVPLLYAARIVNTISHTLLVVFVFFYLRRHAGTFGGLLGAMLIASSWMFIVWDLGGLDEILYACLNTIGVLTGLRYLDSAEPRRERFLFSGVALLAIATLARPEGSLLLAGLWVVGLVAPKPADGNRWRPAVVSASIGILILLPMVLFRWFYFHEIAPNTMYAKMGGISPTELLAAGARYLLNFLLTPPFLGVGAGIAALFCLARRCFTSVEAGLWWFIGLIAFFPLVSGGDHMIAFRFCIPMYSLFAVVLVRHLSNLGVLRQPDLMPVFIGLLFTVLAFQTRTVKLNPRYADPAASVGQVVGEYIRDHWKPNSVVALNTAGATPFFSDSMQYIDMLGLNDLEIARRKDIPREGPWTQRIGHLKGDGASVLARHPDYIILGPADGTTVELKLKAFFLGDYELANSPQFQRDYKPCIVALPKDVTFTFYKNIALGTSCP